MKTVNNTRINGLLLDLAGHFDRKCAIAHEEWLAEKDVSMTEIDVLFSTASVLLEAYAKGNAQQKAKILAACALSMGQYI